MSDVPRATAGSPILPWVSRKAVLGLVVVLVIGAAPESAPGLDGPLNALRRLVDAGAKPRPAASVVAELTGTSANALYRALTEAATDA